ncbi:MAG TPA: hypothetical protein VGH19_07140 [Verrucomicrobiae bacterium]
MKFSAYILSLGMLAAIGCSDSEPEVPAVPAPAPAATVDPVASSPVAPTGPAPAVASPAAAPAGDVEPELKPIQNAIETFQAQNKRMPLHVDELVSSGAIQSLPTPPPGKIYFIDQATKRIRLGGRD